MNITQDQIEFISNSLEFHGLQTKNIKDDIIDHICTTIEESNHTDFTLAYEEAIQKLGGYYNIKQLEKETKQLLHGKMLLKTKRIQYIIGALMTIIIIITMVNITGEIVTILAQIVTTEFLKGQ